MDRSGFFALVRGSEGAWGVVAEQIPAVATEQAGAVAEQPLAVAAQASAPVADSADRTVADIDLSTPEAVRKFLAQYPASQAVLADERNAERQRLQAEMRREQGSQEAVTQQMASLITRLNAGEDPQAIAKDMPLLYTAAQDRARIEFAKNLFEQAKQLDPDSVAALDGFAENPDLTPEQFMALAQAATNAVASKSRSTGKQELLDTEDIAALPDSKLKTALLAAVAREAEIEMNARQVEANRVPGSITTPAGGATEQMTRQAFDAMTPENRTAYIASERKRVGSADHLWDLISA